ncbi:LOW QUALITY PROTEIN: pneumococcal serine-rich repeat protein-like [Trachinotus anak]|uniref:LOW QUALITY PROTEIN: pneumococcal serine-rich repeat protein-like n=1 Tax=Trachinotus anak TaxID=443729 RepID=UPI0039F25446
MRCDIVSATSPSASTLNVVWSSYTGTSVLLDLRVVNSTSVAPVVVMQSAPSTQRLIQGLRPGHVYQVTLKVFEFYAVVCTDVEITMTVPATSQITFSKAISSTSIKFEWSSVIGADSYILFVEELFSFPARKYNQTFTTLSGQVDGLTPSTTYNCYIYSSNSAGRGAQSNIRTITTLVQPPTGVALVPTGKSTARVTWDSVSKVLLYQVTVSDNDNPSNAPVITNTSATSMDISNLEPCSTYTVGVSSVNVFLVPGEASNITHTTSSEYFSNTTDSYTLILTWCCIAGFNSSLFGAPQNILDICIICLYFFNTFSSAINPVTTISVDYSCSSGMVTVTWDLVFGANLYRATAVDGTGESLNCTSASTSCQITMLKCGEKYQVHVVAISDDCESTSNTSTLFETGGRSTCSCGNYSLGLHLSVVPFSMLVLSVPHHLSVYVSHVHADTTSLHHSLSHTLTFLDIFVFLYYCTILSNSLSPLFSPVPCAPANTQTLHDCSSNAIVFSWQPTNNTYYYVATGVDSTGKVTECRTVDNTCYFTNTGCGQSYTYTVYAVSSECNSEVSQPQFVRTCDRKEPHTALFICMFPPAPCLPTNIKTAAECHPDLLITTWDSAAGALSYTVEAQGNTGETYNCTSSSNSCAVTGVPCGEHLSVWIVASNDKCTTNRVLGEVAQTGTYWELFPCSPINVSASVDCSQDSARVNWTTRAGSIFYIAIAQDADGNSHSCNSMGTDCLIEGLRCGQNYTTSVIGTNLKCNSTASEEVTFMTGRSQGWITRVFPTESSTSSPAPCPPTNIEAFRDCEANHALIVWQNHQPTGLYTATIEDQSGAQLTCTSNTVNNCKITSLPCGKRYNVTVTYNDGNCPSTSTPISMDSVPCGPEDVRASVTCVTGELTVTWNISIPAENYTTIISRGVGQPLYCNSTETQCSMGGLLCGSSYGVVVFSVTGTCFSLPMPCPPTNVTAVRTCAEDPVPVSWVASDSAKYYTAVATSSGGHRSECSTNNTYCSLPGLQCGQVYTIGVSGADDNCTGQLSSTVSLDTGNTTLTTTSDVIDGVCHYSVITVIDVLFDSPPEPCAPSNVSSQLICSAGIAQVSWAPSANAVSYDVKATSNGQILTCNSSSPNCTLSDLVCGQEYEIHVAATDGTCVSNYSAPFTQDQVPCAPQNVSTNLLCGTDDLMVSWILSPEPFNYSATAVPLAGNISSVSCHSNSASCSLTGLQCGQTYNVSVKASSGSCSGPYSSPQTVQTAPCPPQSLTAVTDCGTNSLLASWHASLGATTYMATVTGPNGFSDTCSSSNLTCSVSGLQCASRYNITVTSQDGHCTSAPSQTVITTGPCDPVNVTSNLYCGSDMATVSWVAAAGAAAYTVVAQEGSSQNYISCTSNTTSCQLSQLQCGKVYNLTVVAQDATCNSTGSSRTVLMTAPCSPSVQNITEICGTNSSSVSWQSMADATGYIVNATATSGHKASCSSATATCTLTDLLCSESYTATVTARGSQCDSAPGPSANITTAPCPPAIISKQYMCGTNTAVFSWTGPAGSLSYLAQVAGEGHQDSRQTTNTSCMFQNLPCGLDFNITVQAQGAQCNSIPSVSQSLETVACAPQNVSATLLCSNHSALVTWVGSPIVVGYNVTVTGQDGHTHHCHTNTTSCKVPDIHCGESYSITVTPYSKTCTGDPSAVYSFRAGLCAPSNVTVSPACEDSIVSWSPVTGAEMYIATATADDGHAHTCSSNYSNTCNFTDLHCGETYSVSVVTVDRGCWSEPSSAVVLRTALCPGTNLTGQVSCDTNILTLTWDQSSVSGATYTLQTERIGGTLPPSVHTTSNTSYTLTNLLCGQRYAFRIAARDGNCRSSYSPPIEISTAPCQPTNFTARVDCGTNKGNFSWVESIGAGFYTVEVTGEHGHVASCSSNDTSCAVKLDCGRSYSATLVASTESCNSTKHADIHFDSAPCLPEDVLAEVACDTNVMNVSWTRTAGSDDYTAWAISTDGHRASCNSTSNSCSIHDLQCGRVYEVAVTSSSIHCSIIAGSDYRVQSAPCKPENITVDQNCSSNIMTVKWSQSSTTQNYSVKATSASGVDSTCDSTESSCSFLDLSCGQLYTFTVMGHTNVCMSDISDPLEKMTAPCPPTNVSATLNCTAHNALVSWSSAAAATGYSVQATSANGHNSSCSEMGTSCNLNSLVCGQEYSVVVEAMHTGCPGPASAPVWLATEPCAPTNLSVHYNMSTAWVMWGAASGASSYSVEAVTDQGSTVTCNTTNNSCFLNGLQCSQIYNVTVTAHNLACDSLTSETHCLMTEPCPPTNVQANMVCEHLTATVSWEQSNLAVGYVAYFDDQNGHDTSCASTDTQCSLSGLTCGTVYSVWVKALGWQYNSSDSTVVSLRSEPCQPSGIEAIMDCEAHSATVSWQPSVGAVSYAAELTASSGHTTSCTTNHTNCELSSPQCGEEYNITVMALGQTCNSTAQMPGYLTTEPCVPTNLSVHYNVSTAQVMWDAASGANSYSVEAVTDQGSMVTCNTTNNSCLLNGLQCSQIYNITVMARNLVCNNTVTSEPYRLMTEPCPPTNVQANMACEQLTSAVSWEQSDLAVGYVAYFDDQNGHYMSCVTTDTQCTVSGLTCGTVYSVWVKALGQQYNSSDSTVVSLISAPCLPREVEIEVNCNSDGATVSWNTTYGTANFSLTAIVSGSLQTLCTTQQNRCYVTGLTCGETYNLSLTASNQQCSLTAPMHANLTTRPCPPQHVAVDLQCGSRTAVVSWEERSDVELYMATAIKASGGEGDKCNSTGSTCQFPSLACGEMYNFTVTAHSQGCYSQASSTVSIQTEPCQPVIVSAQALCQSEEVQISWHQASGVVNYLVTATGSLGYVEIYNTTQTLLSATLPCGQDYNVTVQGLGSECVSNRSRPAFFKTSPCIPWDVKTYVQCEFNMGSVSWGPSDGAEAYVATATGLDGHTHQCLTNTTSCTWNDLHCGEDYTVVVRAKDGNCTSLPSNSSVIHMNPCVPQNLVASVDCNMNVVSLNWDASNRTELYMVSAEAGNKTTGLTTNVTTAHFSDCTCGQNYSLTVTPHSQHCPGSSSASAFVQTWPCPPSGVSTLQDCLSGIVMVTWQASNGSDYYTVTTQTDTGMSGMCMSDSNQCSFPGLTCGYNFSVSVTASNQQCNTTASETTSLQSVPCAPTDVSVVMDCANNTAVVSWSASRGALQYSVTARSSHSNVSCHTSDLNCSLDNLTCGSRYSVQVVAIDDSCSSVPTQAWILNSAPCPPQNMSAQFSCSSNDLTISWDAVREADHFLVSVIAENGGIIESCNTTNTACSISNVTCGKTFSAQVVSVRGDCRSQHSQTHSITSAPCQPQGIRGNLDCVTNSAWISWDAAAGADSYTVSAVGGEDYTANCTTSTNTTCEVEDLACGVLYNFSVIAMNSQCESQPSATIDLETAPCSLSGITAFPQCHNSSILVMWELMEGSNGNTEYTATAEASDHTYLSCNNTGTSCYLYGARCDLHYTIIVAASSDQCSSMRSPPYRVSMEPCPPTNVMVSSSCEDLSALVSWTPSPVAESYHVVAMGGDGHVHTCNTTSSNCSVSELHCDQQYTVVVTASHENCSSKASQNATLNTGPCQPAGLSVMFHCHNQSALLSWMPRDNTVDYYGCAQSGNGDMLYCHSTSPTCTIEGLDCGTVYNFSVQASDGTCNSSFSDPVQRGAASCPPDTIEVQLLPMQMEIQVMRFSWTQVSCRDTEYMLSLTGSLLGDSQALFELASYWTNRTYFEIPLPCSSSYVATVQSRNGAGTSDPSVPLNGTTAPCPPSGVLYSGNSSFATVSWNASVFATTYTVYDNSVTPRAQLCSVAGLSCSLSNITSSHLLITASNAAGESEAISVTNAVPQGRRRRDLHEMQNGGLSAPVLDVTQAMSTVIFVEWSQVEATSYYTLLIKKQDRSSNPQELTVYGENIILTDLSPNSNYCFSVSASNSAASGPESEPVCVQTGAGLPQ